MKCNNCGIEIHKPCLSWVQKVLIFWGLMGIIPGIIMLCVFKRKTCPACGKNVYKSKINNYRITKDTK